MTLVSTPLPTARHSALIPCHACGRLEPGGTKNCTRCHAQLQLRKPDSVSRTWAMLTAAAILYVPANILPVMRVVSMGSETSDTIMGGILYFLRTGSWPLALLIFFASIVVPLFKLAILSVLLLSVRRKSRWNPAFRTKLYHVTEIIGRWSMVDIFAVTLMVAMVEMGAVATIEPGPGAVAFAAVVMVTMLASHSFDPRLLWDAMEDEHE